MKLAIITQSFAVRIDREAEAAELALRLEEASRAQIESVIKGSDNPRVTGLMLDAFMAPLGVSVTMVPSRVYSG